MAEPRDRDGRGRPRNARPRDRLGRPLPRDAQPEHVEEQLPDNPEELLALGVAHFNAGRYFQAHECWETAWHAAAEGERDFWQGLTQIAVGYTHRARGNARGATTLLRRGAAKVDRYPDGFHSIPTKRVAAAARSAADVIERRGTDAPIPAPSI